MKSRTFKCEGERNEHTLHYEQVFGNVFERRESKCCAVSMKYVKHQEKKLQSIGISRASLHTFMITLKDNISEAYKVQGDCLEVSESDSCDKNDMKEKVNDLVRLYEAMQKDLKTASYSEQIQILTLVPDKRSQMYC